VIDAREIIAPLCKAKRAAACGDFPSD